MIDPVIRVQLRQYFTQRQITDYLQSKHPNTLVRIMASLKRMTPSARKSFVQRICTHAPSKNMYAIPEEQK